MDLISFSVYRLWLSPPSEMISRAFLLVCACLILLTTLYIFDRFGEIRSKLGTVVERDHEELVLRVRGLEELNDGFARLLDLVIHTPAHIENHAERDGSIFTGKVLYFLQLAAFQYGKVFLVQAGDNAVPVVGNGYVHQDQIHIHNGAGFAMVLNLRQRAFGTVFVVGGWRVGRPWIDMNIHVLGHSEDAKKQYGEQAPQSRLAGLV